MPTTPSVDVETGSVSNGLVKSAHAFVWACSEAGNGTQITVTANLMGNGNPWFSPSPVTFTTPNSSEEVTAEGVSPVGGWKWSARGVNVDANAHVNVTSSVPQARAS